MLIGRSSFALRAVTISAILSRTKLAAVSFAACSQREVVVKRIKVSPPLGPARLVFRAAPPPHTVVAVVESAPDYGSSV